MDVASVGADGLLVHDAHREIRASRSRSPTSRSARPARRRSASSAPVERPVYGEAMDAQLEAARASLGDGDLETLLHAGDTWVVDLRASSAR